MKTLTILTGLALLVATSFSKLEAKIPFNINTNLTMRSRYIAMAGFDFEDVPVVQSSVIAEKKCFYGLLWSNINLKKKKITEVDCFFGYSKLIKGMNFDISFARYDLIGRGKYNLYHDFHELWLSINKPGKLSTKLLFVQSIDGDGLENSKSNYLDIALKYQDKLPISIGTSIQYNNKYYINDRGFSFAVLNLSFPFKIKDVNISPEIRYHKKFKEEFVQGVETRLSVNF